MAKTSDFGAKRPGPTISTNWLWVRREKRRAKKLYDLSADPREEHDIASQHPDVVRRMRGELENWQRSVERSLSGADYPTTAR